MKRNNELSIFLIRIGMGVLFLIPGIFKVLSPEDFMAFLVNDFPGFLLPLLPFLFWSTTAYEIITGIFFLIGYKIKWVTLPAAFILLVALITVVPNDESKIGLINALFHIVGIITFISFFFVKNYGIYSLEKLK